ncbi:MAG: hypothetical protein ACK50V_01015 [Alphaproteobacteria bacterium]
MISPFLKRALSALLATHLTLSPVIAAYDHDVENMAGALLPQRSVPYVFEGPTTRTLFKEYFLSPLGHDCAFKAFRTTRAEAITFIEKKIQGGSQETIRLLDKAMETDVLNQGIKLILDGSASQEEKRRRYLSHYKMTTTMVECYQNEPATTPLNAVSLLDVLSYVYRVNLRVYIPAESASATLQLFHKRSLDDSNGTLSLLLKNAHYNLLLREQDPPSLHEKALRNEESSLNEYQAQLRREAQETHDALEQIRQEKSSLEETMDTSEVSASSRAETLLGQGIAQTPRSEETPRPARAISPVPQETAPQVLTSHTFSRRLSHESIVDFLNRKARKLPRLSYEDSLARVWQHAEDLMSRSGSSTLQKTIDLINGCLYKSALILDHGFVPPTATVKTRLEQLKTALITTSRDARVKSSILGRHYNVALHHMTVYLGRCFSRLREHDLAWRTLSSTLSHRYTRSASLEMARLVLEEGYRPQDMVGQSREEYALSLLNKTSHTVGRAEPQSRKSGGPREQITFAHTPYLSSKEGRRFAKNLMSLAKQTERAPSQEGAGTTRVRASLPHRALGTSLSVEGAQDGVGTDRGGFSQVSSNPSSRKRPREHSLGAHTQNPKRPHASSSKRLVTDPREDDDEMRFMRRSSSPQEKGPFEDGKDRERVSSPIVSPVFYEDTEDSACPIFDPEVNPEEVLASRQTPAQEGPSLGHMEELLMRATLYAVQGQRQKSCDLCLDILKQEKEIGAARLRQRVFNLLASNQFSGLIYDRSYTRIDCYLESLRLAKTLQDSTLMSQAYFGLGHAHFDGRIEGKHYTNADCYVEGLRLAKDLGDTRLMSQAYMGLGNGHCAGKIDGKSYTDIDCYLEGLRLAKDVGDARLMAQAYVGLGNIFFEGEIDGRRYTNIDCYLEGMRHAKEVKDRKFMVQAYVGLGNSHFTGQINGEHYTKQDCFLEGLRLAKELGDAKLTAQAYVGLGNSLYKGLIDGKSYTNTDCFLEALRLAKETRDHKLMIQAYIGLGNVRFEGEIEGNKHTRLTCYLEGLQLAKNIKNSKLMAQAYIRLGNGRFSVKIDGKSYTNKDFFLEGLRLAKDLGDEKLMVQAYVGLGNALFKGLIDGKSYTGKDCFLEGLRLAKNIGDEKLMVQAYMGLGNGRFSVIIDGKSHIDTDFYLEGLRLAKELGDAKLMAQACVGLGNAHFTGLIDGKHYMRVDCYLEGLRLAKELKDHKLMVQAYMGLGNAACSRRDNEGGLYYFREAQNIAYELNDKRLMEKAQSAIDRSERFLKKWPREDAERRNWRS